MRSRGWLLLIGAGGQDRLGLTEGDMDAPGSTETTVQGSLEHAVAMLQQAGAGAFSRRALRIL